MDQTNQQNTRRRNEEDAKREGKEVMLIWRPGSGEMPSLLFPFFGALFARIPSFLPRADAIPPPPPPSLFRCHYFSATHEIHFPLSLPTCSAPIPPPPSPPPPFIHLPFMCFIAARLFLLLQLLLIPSAHLPPPLPFYPAPHSPHFTRRVEEEEVKREAGSRRRHGTDRRHLLPLLLLTRRTIKSIDWRIVGRERKGTWPGWAKEIISERTNTTTTLPPLLRANDVRISRFRCCFDWPTATAHPLPAAPSLPSCCCCQLRPSRRRRQFQSAFPSFSCPLFLASVSSIPSNPFDNFPIFLHFVLVLSCFFVRLIGIRKGRGGTD